MLDWSLAEGREIDWSNQFGRYQYATAHLLHCCRDVIRQRAVHRAATDNRCARPLMLVDIYPAYVRVER